MKQQDDRAMAVGAYTPRPPGGLRDRFGGKEYAGRRGPEFRAFFRILQSRFDSRLEAVAA